MRRNGTPVSKKNVKHLLKIKLTNEYKRQFYMEDIGDGLQLIKALEHGSKNWQIRK